MRVVRVVAEHLFLFVFRIARVAFLMQGVAMCAALLASTLIRSPDAPPWLGLAVRSSLFVSATLFVAGILLALARRVPEIEAERRDDAARPGWPWPLLLGLSLLALPVLAYAGAAELLPLWREIAQLLDGIGFWKALASAGPYSGIVLLPILVALFVPTLETAAAFFLIAAPPALLILLFTRSRRFATIFAMLIACQVGLVLAGLLASDAFSRLANEAIAAMTAADDVEVHRAVDVARGAQEILATTASALVAPMLGYLAWLPFLLRARSAGGFFTAGDASIPVQTGQASSFVSVAARTGPSAATPPPPTRARSPGVRTARTSGRRVGLALVALGAFMLAFGAMELLRPRARYARSDPAPGAALVSSPTIARVTFDGSLDPSSALSVTRMTTGSDGEDYATVFTRSGGLDASDSARRTLKVELSGIPDGLYHAAWSSVPASGGVVRHGSYYFGVGRAGSDSVVGSEPLQERDSGERQRRRAFAGGVLLLVLGVVSLATQRAANAGQVSRGAHGD